LADVFQGLALPSPTSNGSVPSTTGPAASALVQSLVAQATADFNQAQTDLKAGNFAAYGTDVTNLQSVLQQLQQASGTAAGSSSSSPSPKATTTTTTTTTPTNSSGVASSTRRPAKVPPSVALGARSH